MILLLFLLKERSFRKCLTILTGVVLVFLGGRVVFITIIYKYKGNVRVIKIWPKPKNNFLKQKFY